MARVILSTAVVMITFTMTSFAGASESSRAVESRLAFLQNRDRTAFGRPALRFSSYLSSLAREHAQDMAAAGRIWHDPALPSVIAQWKHVGDNVGRSTQVDSLHTGFMASAEHRDNLMFWGYEQYGVGAAIARDGRVYAAIVFFSPYVTPRASRAPATVRNAPAQAPPQTIEMLEAVVALDAGVA